MGVDGIGSGGRPVPGVGGGELDGPRGVEVDPAESAGGAASTFGAERSTGSALLDQLKRGEIDLDGYLDAQVNAATAHVQGSLPAAQLDFIREALREQIATDPVLTELVRRATGSTPPSRVG
jgi:hypothetical protein